MLILLRCAASLKQINQSDTIFLQDRHLHKACKEIVSDWLYCFYNAAQCNKISIVFRDFFSLFSLSSEKKSLNVRTN